jgi:nucleoredoxin
MEELLGEFVINNEFEPVMVETVLNSPKYFGLYFSASWCRPCHQFTRQLFHFYKQLNKNEKQFEVIFVSKDKDMNQFSNYFNIMPW